MAEMLSILVQLLIFFRVSKDGVEFFSNHTLDRKDGMDKSSLGRELEMI
jgi:hypothetical protein